MVQGFKYPWTCARLNIVRLSRTLSDWDSIRERAETLSFFKKNEDWWIALRILLSPRNLGPTPWIRILEDKDLEERAGENLRKT
jgi:hypothetical protein